MAYAEPFIDLEKLYHDVCCTGFNTLAWDNDWSNEFDLDAWVQDIYRNGNGKPDMRTIQKYAGIYWDAVKSGYLDFDVASHNLLSPDGVMLQHLADNVYHFSAAKNYTHLRQLTSLINDNGRVREWKSFEEEALKLNVKYNKTWLKTEYDLALAGSTMASKWAQYETSPNAMLRYDTVGDARVRDAHKALNGTTLPVSHPFWNTHYPPNGWKCRCDVVRLPYSATPTSPQAIPNGIDSIPPMMQVNVGKEKLLFSQKHPYFKGEVADQRIQSFMPYIAKTTENGFNVYESKAAIEHTTSQIEAPRIAKEYAERINAAAMMADVKGNDAILLPNLNKIHPMHELFYKNNLGFTGNCDGYIPNSNYYFEVKSYDGLYEAGKLNDMLDKACTQAPNLVYVLHHNINLEKLTHSIISKVNNPNHPLRQQLKEIYIITNDGKAFKIK